MLSSGEIKVLKEIHKNPKIISEEYFVKNSVIIENLCNKKLIFGECFWADNEPQFYSGTCDGVTERGKAYLEEQKKITKDYKKQNLRYWITTGIACAALITSILAIIVAYT